MGGLEHLERAAVVKSTLDEEAFACYSVPRGKTNILSLSGFAHGGVFGHWRSAWCTCRGPHVQFIIVGAMVILKELLIHCRLMLIPGRDIGCL